MVENAATRPDGELCKEVYAHYGLCMYLAQVFETGLINILTALETAASEHPDQQTFEVFYERHEGLTFGNLMKALAHHHILPDDLTEEVRLLKAERDRLAHHFWREHDLDFMTVGGCHVMIERLEQFQCRFADLDRRVTQIQTLAFDRLGFGRETFDTLSQQAMAEMQEEAITRYASSPSGS